MHLSHITNHHPSMLWPRGRTVDVVRNSNTSTRQSLLSSVMSFRGARGSRLRYDAEFEELALLGRGGFGSVVKVQNRVDGRLYAVKRISLAHSDIGNEKVLREVKLLSRLEHPLIVRYYNAFIEEGSVQSMFPYTDMDEFDDDCSESMSASKPNKSGRVGHSFLHSDSIFVGVSFPSDRDSVDSISKIRPLSDNGLSGDMPPPSLTCNICSQLYADWTVSFPEWHLLEGSLQTLNLCVDCYLRQLTALGVTARPHIQYLQRQPSYLYIQTELCGQTLKDVLSDWTLLHPTSAVMSTVEAFEFAERSKWNLLAQLARGLAFLHGQGVAHRDIKPSNCFLSLEGIEWRVKIGDLGLAKLMDLSHEADEHHPHRHRAHDVDRSASIVGTALYAPPESDEAYVSNVNGAHSGFVDASAARDMYALGIVLFEMWYPFSTSHQRAQVLQQLAVTRCAPEDWSRSYPAQAALVAALLGNPAKRPSASRLVGILTGGTIEPSSNGGFDVFHAAAPRELADEQLTEATIMRIRQVCLASAASSLASMPVCATCANSAAMSTSSNQSSDTLMTSALPTATAFADVPNNDHVIRGASFSHSTATVSAESTPCQSPACVSSVLDIADERIVLLERENAALRAELARLKASCTCGATST